MNDKQIYVKTKAGESTLNQRTRLVQRNLRMVLINVDGLATVDELKRRLGDGNMVESSLTELERLELIELGSGEGKTQAATTATTATMTSPGFLLEGQHVDSPRGVEASAVISRQRPGRFSLIFEALHEKRAQWRQKRMAATQEKAFRQIYEMPTEADTIEQIKLKRIRRGPRRVISGPLLAIMILAGGMFLLTLLAMLFPYQRYLPEMERRISLAVHAPVNIAEVHFSVLPYPNITLERVSVGAVPYLTARVIRIVPNLFQLFAATPVLSDVHLDGLLIRSQGILPSAHWFSAAAAGEGGVLLRGVHFDDIAIEIGDATIDGLSGKVEMSATGSVDRLMLANAEHTLRLEMKAVAAGYRMSVVGNNWMMPFKPGLMFEYLDAQGEVTPGSLRFSSINGRMYDGMVEGTALFDWSQGAMLVGDIKLARASIGKLFAALNPDLALEGDISGKLHLESHAKGFSRLLDGLNVDGDFLVAQGIINRFDLVEAVRSNRQTRGGFTRFERFSGSLQFEDQGYQLSKLKISSGLMQATGHLNIGPKQELKGQMEVRLTGTATQVRGSVGVAGSLKNPLLSPLRGQISP